MDRVKVQWLSPALGQLDRIYDYLVQRNPQAARDVFLRIRRAAKNLTRFPETGRRGHVAGTRELPVSGLPYLIVYRVNGDTVEILRVFHTAMNWPEQMRSN